MPTSPRNTVVALLMLYACGPADVEVPPAETQRDDTSDPDTPPAEPDEEPEPISEGIAGGWTIEHHDEVLGARFFHPVDTDKDGAIVAARMASAMAGLGQRATSDARRGAIQPTQLANSAYVDQVAGFIVDDLYGAIGHAGQQPLLGEDTLVFSSVHRAGLYVAEALHARLLPLQVMSFADDWSQATDAAERSVVIVGQDFDYDGLWLWNRVAAGEPGTPQAQLPEAYARALREARQVVIVQPDDQWTLCTELACSDTVHERYTDNGQTLFLHSSLTRALVDNPGTRLYAQAVAAGQISPASREDAEHLKQWEWGVSDRTVQNLRAVWQELGRAPEDLVVVRAGVVDLFAQTPHLWRAYLERNGRAPSGVHVTSYWAAFPALERQEAILPFPAYTWWTPDWHPLDDNARELLAELCPDGACPPSFAAQSRAFVNTVGSSTDVQGVGALFRDHGLTRDRGSWFGVGLNALGAGPWTDPQGDPVPPGWEIAAQVTTVRTWTGWQPLTLSEVCAVMPCR